MQRVILLMGAGGTLLILAGMALNFVRDPLAAEKADLAMQLAQAPPPTPETVPVAQYDKFVKDIASKPAPWSALTPEPEKAKPLPPPPPKAPNVKEMLDKAGVKPTRAQIGTKIKIITEADPKGKFYAVGDSVGGCNLKEFDKTSVTFSVNWTGGEVVEKLDRQ